jgi:hypothetical protein
MAEAVMVVVMEAVDTAAGMVKLRSIAAAATVVGVSNPMAVITEPSSEVFPMDHGNSPTGEITSFSTKDAFSAVIMTDSSWWLLRSG